MSEPIHLVCECVRYFLVIVLGCCASACHLAAHTEFLFRVQLSALPLFIFGVVLLVVSEKWILFVY